MELAGDEKRIQALFSELSLENQSRAPQFGHLWTRAQAKVSVARSIGTPVAVLLSLLVTAGACSLAVWTWYTSTQNSNLVIQPPPSVTLEARYTPTRIKVEPPRKRQHVARRRHVDRNLATEVALLSNWQSPTQQFMSSPTDLALGSLPTLNQSVKDLESFLSKNSEIMKESNQ
jgi:hypothetical protein